MAFGKSSKISYYDESVYITSSGASGWTCSACDRDPTDVIPMILFPNGESQFIPLCLPCVEEIVKEAKN